MTASPPLFALPRVALQHDLPTVLSEIRSGDQQAAEDCWCSCLSVDRPSVHGKLRLSEGEERGTVEVEGRDRVLGKLLDSTTLEISCDKLGVPSTLVRFPSLQPATLRGGVLAFDVSPDGARVAVGGQGGSLRVKATASSKETVCKGHVGDVTVVKFFPSGEVLMTGSMDMSIRIWSALDGTNPRTLTSHTKSITSLLPLGRGRQILSSSLDGSVKLWSVASSTVEKTWRFSQPVSGLVLLPLAAGGDEETAEGRRAVVSHTNGTASVVELSSESARSSIMQPLLQLSTLTASPVDSLALEGDVVALGGRYGVVSLFRLPSSLPTPTAEEGAESIPPYLRWSRSEVAVNCLAFSSPTSLLVATADGLPYIASISDTVMVSEELAGLDTDAATEISEVSGAVWMSSKDGGVRCYRRR